MTAFFRVRNFEKFQHYKDRSPPWIKLYNEVLDDYEFGQLPDASKMHLVAIWLLASRSNNRIPYDPTWVARRINASDPVDLDVLERAGFIVVDQPLQKPEQHASAPLATCSPEREGETETEVEVEVVAPAAPSPPPASKKSNGHGSRLPDTWGMSPKLDDWVRAEYPWLDPPAEEEKFIDYWTAAAGQKARKLDWDAAFRTWIRKAAEYASSRTH